MTPAEHEEHIGYARFIEDVEQAESFIDEAARGIAPEHWAEAAIVLLDEADELLADATHRGAGAMTAQWYRKQHDRPTAAELREQAAAILYSAAEASAITGGNVDLEAG